jgi:hypothetical protein
MERFEGVMFGSFVDFVRNLPSFKLNLVGDGGSHKVHKATVLKVKRERHQSAPIFASLANPLDV